MTYQREFDIDTDNQLIKVTGKGNINNEDARLMFREALLLLSGKGFKRLLVDSQDVILRLSPMEIFQFVDRLAAEFNLEGIRIARVIKLDSFSHELVEQVAERQGVQIRNFEDATQAVSWLCEDLEPS